MKKEIEVWQKEANFWMKLALIGFFGKKGEKRDIGKRFCKKRLCFLNFEQISDESITNLQKLFKETMPEKF